MRRNFSLLELLVIVVILAILISLLFPTFAKARNAAGKVQCCSNLKQIGIAVYAYSKNSRGRVPGKILSSRYSWLGKAQPNGGRPVTKRPLNPYLGYTKNGIETPIARCPGDNLAAGLEDGYQEEGSSYTSNTIADAQEDTVNTLAWTSRECRDAGLDENAHPGRFISQAGNPAKLLTVIENAGYRYGFKNKSVASYPQLDWHQSFSNHINALFLDGRAEKTLLFSGSGGLSVSAWSYTWDFDAK